MNETAGSLPSHAGGRAERRGSAPGRRHRRFQPPSCPRIPSSPCTRCPRGCPRRHGGCRGAPGAAVTPKTTLRHMLPASPGLAGTLATRAQPCRCQRQNLGVRTGAAFLAAKWPLSSTPLFVFYNFVQQPKDGSAEPLWHQGG